MHVLIDSDSVSVFAGCARDLATTGKMLILLLDDATTLDPATTRFLVKLADELDGALRVVFCATDGPEVTSLLEQLPETTQSIRFDEPMSAEEVEDLIDARLAWGRVNDELRELFDENTVSQLHAKTGGVPKLVLIAARAIASQSLGSRRPEDPMGRGALRRRIREAQRAGVPLGSARQKPREFWSRVWPSQPGRPDAWWVLFYSLILALGVMALMLARPGNLADEPGLNQGYQRSELPNAQRPSTRDRSLANRP
jgi:hypothetical protein